MGVGREDSRDLKNIFFSVGVSHFDRVPRGRFEIGDDNFRPWQGVILYRAITIVSLPVIRTKALKLGIIYAAVISFIRQFYEGPIH